MATITFPNESLEYRTARNDLLEQEIALRRETEAVAGQRRQLPPGGAVPVDYTFQRTGTDGQVESVRISELFSDGKDTLAIYSLMFGPDRERPCPFCSRLLQQLDSGADQVNQAIDFVVAARSPIERIEAAARDKGWQRLRFVSSGASTYNLDYHGSSPDGDDSGILNIFHKDGDTIRHVWSDEFAGEGFDPIDLLLAHGNMLDLTPAGRPR